MWRATGSLLYVSIYNLLSYVGLPVGFFLNGLLLRKARIEKIFAFGSALMGLGALLIVIFGSVNYSSIPLFGFLWGLGRGFYWGNRNYLEFKETTNEWRQYFYGFLSSVSSLSNILVPFLAGWFIVLVSYAGIFSAKTAYWMLFLVAFILMMLCALVIFNGSFETPVPKIISRLGIQPFWNRRRSLNVAAGLFDGLDYVGILLVLYVLGNEGILGTISSLTAVCVAVALYIYGRKVKLSIAKRTFSFSGLIYFLSAFLLIILPEHYGVGIYYIFTGIALSFFQVSADPELLRLSDGEMIEKVDERYSFIFDNELFLNIGRMLGISIIIGLAMLVSEKAGFFYGPLIISALHLVFVLSFRKLGKNINKS